MTAAEIETDEAIRTAQSWIGEHRYEVEGDPAADPVVKILQPGKSLKLKFRQPFAVKDYYFEMHAEVLFAGLVEKFIDPFIADKAGRHLLFCRQRFELLGTVLAGPFQRDFGGTVGIDLDIVHFDTKQIVPDLRFHIQLSRTRVAWIRFSGFL